MSRRSLFVLLLSFATMLLDPVRAVADEGPTAKQAYDRGVSAFKRGDEKGAAQEFARADALEPTPVALQAALDAAIEADDLALASVLLERSKRAPATPGLAASITAAHLAFRDRLTAPRAASSSSMSTPPDGGLPPIVAYGGIGLSTVLAGLTTYFAIRTSDTHDAFANAGCEQENRPPCATLRSDGESRQQFTNVGFVSTLIVGLATAIIGFGFTDWNASGPGSHDRRGAMGAPGLRF